MYISLVPRWIVEMWSLLYESFFFFHCGHKKTYGSLFFQVSPLLEICLVPKTRVASQYPCLVLFNTVARMMRPVQNLAQNRTEMIGSFEQVYMNICVTPSEAIPGVNSSVVPLQHEKNSRSPDFLDSLYSLITVNDAS